MTDEENVLALRQYLRMLDRSYTAAKNEYEQVEVIRIAQLIPVIVQLTFQPMINGLQLVDTLNRDVVRQIEGVDTYIQATYLEGGVDGIQSWLDAVFTPPSGGSQTRRSFLAHLADRFGRTDLYFNPALSKFEVRLAKRFADELLGCKELLRFVFGDLAAIPDWAQRLLAAAR